LPRLKTGCEYRRCRERASCVLAFGELLVGGHRQTLRAPQYCAEHGAIVRELYHVTSSSPIQATPLVEKR
jgi:hypothetical protein